MPLSSHSLPASSLGALTEAAGVISSSLELDIVLQTVAQLACEVTRGEASSVFSLDARRGKLVVLAAAGGRKDALTGREFDSSLGIPGQVVRSGQPVSVIDVHMDGKFCREIDDLGSLQTRSLIAVPMVHRADVVGVIEVVNRRDGSDFTDTDLQILQVFATLATGATQNARAHQELKRRFEGLRDSVSRPAAIIGDSAGLREVMELCKRVAPSSATVLLLGETGTGKELCARLIHNISRRQHETFAAINCAAMPETLLESELFGHEKGAFTGAHSQHSGWFELAHDGTLFLDEIGDVSRSTQAKLLRVLQEKEFVRVGGTKPIRCNVRIIAATNRNLKHMMIDGLFREDLYYRLSVFPIRLPPLRERVEDIPTLVEHFAAKAAREFGLPGFRVSPRTIEVLARYAWPGNIRELQNVVERSMLMCDGNTLLPCHLPPEIESAADDNDEEEETAADAPTLHGQERALIVRALKANNWNQSRAARALSITRDRLRHRIKKYNIQKPPGSNPQS